MTWQGIKRLAEYVVGIVFVALVIGSYYGWCD